MISTKLIFRPNRFLTLKQCRLGWTMATHSNIVNDKANSQRNREKTRCNDMEGNVPIDVKEKLLKDVTKNPSKVREVSWRVAEPEVKYDHELAAKRLLQRPALWISRNLKIFVPLTFFVGRVVVDLLRKREKSNRTKRAEELLNIISNQSPAVIKAGQSLSSRPDLLPAEYLEALQKLQDRCPPFPTTQAMQLFEKETNLTFGDVFELDNPEPVAAASIGQVYKGRLKSSGARVAIKIQRPGCEPSVAVDLFILRWYADRIQRVFALLKRDLNLISVIDDFGELLYRELDYRAEARNAQRFAELYSGMRDVYVPKTYPQWSTSKVLVLEWVDGVRLNDASAMAALGVDKSRLLDTLVQCTMRQMLENGFFHADPHAGNLLAMSSGKLCYLDFGMVSYVEPAQRCAIIEAVVHLVNRDYAALAELYRRMGFIPRDVDIKPIVTALENALPDVLNAPVGEFNFKSVVGKLGDVMYKFPFSLPPYYIAILRCLGVLEGLAIQVDRDFRIINDAYPYIASRLLTDPAEDLQNALRHLLFKDGQHLRWDRLQDLLAEATQVSDYNIAHAADQLVAYLASDRAASVRGLLARECVDVLDQLETETVELIVREGLLLRALQALPSAIVQLGTADSTGGRGRLEYAAVRLMDRIVKELDQRAARGSSLSAANKTVKILRASHGLSSESASAVTRKMLREPALTALLAQIVSELSGRLAAKTVMRLWATAQRTSPSAAKTATYP